MTRFLHSEIRDIILHRLVQEGVDAGHAGIVADVILYGQMRGIKSHGIALLGSYLRAIRAGELNLSPTFTRSPGSQDLAVEIFNGDHALGPVSAHQAMLVALEKSRRLGAALVGVINAKHFGAAGYYADLAVAQNCIGIVLSAGGCYMVPTNGETPLLGTNPLAIGVPARTMAPFMLDCATSVASNGKIVELERNGTQIPPTWIIGKMTATSYAINPLGCDESGASYKGFGLALAIEILCGILLGGEHFASCSRGRRGHMFIAIDIAKFRSIGDFLRDADSLLGLVLGQQGAQGKRVRYPGDRCYNAARTATAEGLDLSDREYALLTGDGKSIRDDQ